MNSPIRIPTKECIELYENIEKNNYNCWPSYPAIDCNNISLIGRDGNMWTSIDNNWVCTGLIKADSRGSAVGDREAASTFGSDFGQVISKCDKLKSLGLNIRGSDSCISEYDVRKICSIPSLKKLDLRCIECHNISFIPDNIELCCLYKYKKGSDPLSSSGNCNISFM